MLLIPILFAVQELTVWLGIFTGKGHGELIHGVTRLPWHDEGFWYLAAANTGAEITRLVTAVVTLTSVLGVYGGISGLF